MNELMRGSVFCSQSAQPPGGQAWGREGGRSLAGSEQHPSPRPWPACGRAARALAAEGLPRELRADWKPPRASAVQEERQRGKDRAENEVESTSSANEDMPVEKILEAELAVEPKTETYVEANVGLNPSSVSAPPPCSGDGGPGALLGGRPPL